jgi:Ca-activated chloride channel family protein
MRTKIFLTLGLAVTAAAWFSPAQEKKTKDLEYEISVRAISLAVTVQDRGGKYVDDLVPRDFTILENGVRLTMTYFKHDFGAPVSLTVLLDVSGSMAIQDKLAESKPALRHFLTSLLNPQDEASLLIFADGEVEVAARFSTDKSQLLAVLDRTEAYGKTALNDAVAASPEFANRGKNEKRALLLITDGIENDSRLTPYQALEVARRVDVPIYVIGYKIPLSEQYLEKYKKTAALTSAGIIATLDRFSQATGGRAFFVNRPEDLAQALDEIQKEVSHQYIMGYTSHLSPTNEYRKIQVVAAKKKYRVRTRQGY